MTARIKRVRPVQARKEMKSISPREREILARAREQALTFENKMFGEMYATAIERRLLEDDDGLYKFLSHLEQAPVDIETFIDDPQFLGATDLTLWPEVRKAIVDINKYWWKGRGRGAYHEAMLMGATGTGKCLAKGTPVLMFDGTVKAVESVATGDLLMGPDSTSRRVLSLARGREEMFKITPQRGDSYIVNRSHILSLKITGMGVGRGNGKTVRGGDGKTYRSGDIADISVEDYLASSATFKHVAKGWRVGVEFQPSSPLPVDPYYLGAWLGDGSKGDTCIHSESEEVIAYLRQHARKLGLWLYEPTGLQHKRCRHFDTRATVRGNPNQLAIGMRSLGLLGGDKFIPKEYLTASRADRLNLLAGLLDTDGYFDARMHNYEIFTNRPQLRDGILFLARSLGYAASCAHKSPKDQHGNGTPGFRILISGELSDIPVLIQKKKCPKRTPLRDVLLTGITVESVGDGEYFGFEIDGDRRFLLGDFTVTHNTSICMVSVLYTAHILGCLKQPQSVYGLPKATAIVIPIMAAKPHVTKKVVYRPLRKLMEDIPWFQSHMKMDSQVESEIDLKEKNVRIVVGGADEDSILGEAVIGGIIDEINFMNVVLRSKKAEVTSGRAGVYDQAKNIYETMTRRKKGRFITKGPCVGVIFASSSTRYKGDFTDKRKEHIDRVGEKGVYIYNKKQYEVWPQDRYSGKTFRLLVGNDTLSDTRVLEEGEKVPEGALVYDVPVEYEDDFRKNPHDALRDVLGLSTTSIAPFIKRRFTVLECIKRGEEEGLQSFLEKDNVELGRDGMPLVKRGHYCANPSRPRYVHIDLSLSQDRCIAAGQQVLLDGGRRVSVERVRVGDAVITHDGTSKPVVAVHSNGRKQVLDVSIYGWADPLRATGNHRVWAVRRDAVSYANGRLVKPSDRKFHGRSKKAAQARYSFTPEFVELGSLRVGDFLVTPRPVQEDHTMLGDVPLSYEAGYIAGLFAAEGSFYTQNGHEAVQFSLHKNETRILSYLTMAIGKVFGAKTRVIYDKRGSGVTVRATRSDAMTTFLYETIGEYSQGKHMQVWRHGNRAFHAGLCHGYVDGDGYVKYDASGVPVAFHVKTVSMEMADSFYWLLTANGYTVTLSKEDGYTSVYNGEEVTHRPSAKLSVSGRAQMERFAEWGVGHDDVPCSQTISLPGYVLRPIQAICDGGEESVYDLTVADNSSYIVGTSAVHNCGIAMLRFDGLRKVERDGGMIEMLPECSVELACSIAPDANSEIQIAEVRMWVKQLRDVYGYPIKVVTYDGTMSVESRQQWKKEGAKTGYVSVDRTSVPYKQLRDGISDGRVKMFEQPVLVQELFDLEYDGDKDKIDHPVNGCFVAETMVSTEHGPVAIDKVRAGMRVWSHGSSGAELCEVIAAGVTKETSELVDVYMENGKVIRCTPEHLFLLTDGTYKEAQHLTPEDDLQD